MLASKPANFQSEEVKNPGQVFMESEIAFEYNLDPATSYNVII